MSRSRGYCDECAFHIPREVLNSSGKIIESSYVYCHRYAPKPTNVTTDIREDQELTYTFWPIVHSCDTCGEWEQKDD